MHRRTQAAWRPLAFAIVLLSAGVALSQHRSTTGVQVDQGFPEYVPTKPLDGTIRFAECKAMATLLDYWTEDFRKIYPHVRFVSVPIAGNTPGQVMTAGLADIGPLARELPPEEQAAFSANLGYKPLAVRVAGGSYATPDKALAIAFLVNGANPISRLTFAQIDAIYSRDRLRGLPQPRTWGDLGVTGELRSRPIHIWGLVRPGESAHVQVSGNISQFLSDRVLAGGEFRTDIEERTTAGASVSAFDAIAHGIASDPEAIGYGGFNNVIPGVKSVAIAENPSGPFYRGTLQEVARQRYPLSRVIYLYLNEGPGHPLRPEVKEFVKFVLSRQGQQDVIREGIFLPLPYALAAQDGAKLQ